MIRKIKDTDIARCLGICQENFEMLGYNWIDYVKERFKESLDENNIAELEFYVFEEDDTVKGVAGITNSMFSGSIYGLIGCYIDIKFQNLGIGKALTEFRINRIKELGAQIVFSSTQKEWHLKRFGFETIKSPFENWTLMQLNIYK